MLELLAYGIVGVSTFTVGVVWASMRAKLEMQKQAQEAEAEALRIRQQQQKDFMMIMDTITDYKIVTTAASMYLTHGQASAYSYVIGQLNQRG